MNNLIRMSISGIFSYDGLISEKLFENYISIISRQDVNDLLGFNALDTVINLEDYL